MKFNALTYVVYEHIYENIVIYIGSGTINRAFDFNQRNSEYKEKVKDFNKLEVNIVKFFNNRQEAYDFETEYSLSKKDCKNYNLLNIAFGYKLFGENNPMFGKNHSEESKKKMSNSKIGKNLKEETKLKIKNSNIGKHRGDKNSQSIKISVLNLKNNKEIIFGNMKEAAEKIGLSYCIVKRYSLSEKPYKGFLMKRI